MLDEESLRFFRANDPPRSIRGLENPDRYVVLLQPKRSGQARNSGAENPDGCHIDVWSSPVVTDSFRQRSVCSTVRPKTVKPRPAGSGIMTRRILPHEHE